MKITYITQTRFPIQKAHGKQIAEVCTALAALGHEVTLLCPSVHNIIEGDPFSYYDIPKMFRVHYVEHSDATLQWWIPGFLHFAVNMWLYRHALRKFFQSHRGDLLYCRSWEVLNPMLETGEPVILELHTLPRWRKEKFVQQCNRCQKVVCLTSPMQDEIVRWGVHTERVVVEGDGVDLQRFSDAALMRKTEWKLPTHVPIVGYVGSLVTQNKLEKGVGELVQALGILKRRGTHVFGWIVGGIDRDDYYGKKAESFGLIKGTDFAFEAQVPSQWVPSVLSLCDICVYPAPCSNHPYFLRDTSPLKLFEYLAASKPIVCADLPPIRDVVDETMVTFCQPGDPRSIADAIEYVLRNPVEAQRKAQKGKEHVKEFDWKKRMGRILSQCTSS